MGQMFYKGNGGSLQAGHELGKGGEGTVFENLNNKQQVIKLYNARHLPDADKQAKLHHMANIANQDLLNYSAWPLDTLHQHKDGPTIGFLMPAVIDSTPIHMLYSPAQRKQNNPTLSWEFLLHLARNTAAAFASVHSHGHVIGDVNQGNVLAGQNSKVMLIDCDSFQVNIQGKIHPCHVGVSHFTPPELQNTSSFTGIRRSPNHDNFGLALLIFHILFGGRHPYSGKPLRKDVGESLESDIKAFRFAYAKDAQRRGIEPPPMSVPIDFAPDLIRFMLETAFTESGASGRRPTAAQWVTELDHLRRSLQNCNNNPIHVYPDHLRICPWCDLEKSGVVFFPGTGIPQPESRSDFSLSATWAQIEAVSTPKLLAPPALDSVSAEAKPLPPEAASSGNINWPLILIILATGLLTFLFTSQWKLILLVACLLGAGTLALSRKTLSPGLKAELAKRQGAADLAQAQFDKLAEQLHTQSGAQEFTTAKQKLLKLHNEYKNLGLQEQKDIAALKRTAETRQKNKFLEHFYIETAKISGVGPAKKAMLRSFGIETAADINKQRVTSVKGFGESLTRTMLDWRKSCEKKFVFIPKNAVTDADVNSAKAKLATRRQTIERKLLAGADKLEGISQTGISRQRALYPRLEKAAQKLAQARADNLMF